MGKSVTRECCGIDAADFSKSLKKLAGTTRLELATSAVTGQRSNQLNYVPTLFSLGLLETSVLAVFPRFPRFPTASTISTPYHQFRALMDTMDTIKPRASVPAL